MTALSADKKITFKGDVYRSFYVKAAQQIYLGAIVTTKSTGYAYAGTDTAGDKFVGIAEENVLGVTDGVETVKVRCQGLALLTGSGLAITDVGSPVYATDDGTIQTSAANVLVGVIRAVPSATTAWVELFSGPAVSSTVTDFTATGTCAVTGNATFGGTMAITGNTTVGGTLGVTGAVTLTAGITVGTTCAITGNATVGGTLGVTGATTLSSTCAITGNTTVGGTLGVTGASTLASVGVTGAATVGTTLGVTGNTTLGGTCAITGNTTVGGTLAVTGVTTLASVAVTTNATVGGTLGVTGVATFTGRPVLPTVAFASLGAATTTGQICYCSTGCGGLPGILVADGTNWIQSDGSTAAES